eukprot:1147225-Prymnesium_polylepis.2
MELHAGLEGCTVLSWSADEFLQRELAKLPGMLATSWICKSPLALTVTTPSILRLVKPLSLDDFRSRASSKGAARGGGPPEVCIVLRGQLCEEATLGVSIEALPSGDGAEATTEESPQVGEDGERRVRTQRLAMRIDIDKRRGKKLRQIAELFADQDVSPLRAQPSPGARVQRRASRQATDVCPVHVVSGDLTSEGNVTKDAFVVEYRGSLSPSELESELRAELSETLQYRCARGGRATCRMLTTGMQDSRRNAMCRAQDAAPRRCVCCLGRAPAVSYQRVPGRRAPVFGASFGVVGSIAPKVSQVFQGFGAVGHGRRRSERDPIPLHPSPHAKKRGPRCMPLRSSSIPPSASVWRIITWASAQPRRP